MNATEFLLSAVVIGAGATAVMDLWGIVQKRFLGMQPLNYCLLGRWIAYFPRGRFVHDNIAHAARVRGECPLGWSAHYAIGITFAALLLLWCGSAWARNPSLAPALTVGIGTVLAPFFLLQPGMGAGIAASRTPRPNVARLRSLATHTVFGLGLYVAGWCWAFLSRHV